MFSKSYLRFYRRKNCIFQYDFLIGVGEEQGSNSWGPPTLRAMHDKPDLHLLFYRRKKPYLSIRFLNSRR